MHKRNRTIAIIIVVLVSLSMIGSSFVLFFSNSPSTTPTAGTANSSDPQVQSLQSQVDGINQALKANPQDPNLRLSLANSYYDLAQAQSSSTQSSTKDQANASYKQAVAEYQEVTKTNKDVNVLVDMATAAFFGGDNALAETTFKQALTIKPDFFNGLLNYGYFLINGKGDYLGAIAELNKALGTNPSQADADRAKSLISMAQAQLNGNSKSKPATTPAGK